jgi:hypothetical protein
MIPPNMAMEINLFALDMAAGDAIAEAALLQEASQEVFRAILVVVCYQFLQSFRDVFYLGDILQLFINLVGSAYNTRLGLAPFPVAKCAAILLLALLHIKTFDELELQLVLNKFCSFHNSSIFC